MTMNEKRQSHSLPPPSGGKLSLAYLNITTATGTTTSSRRQSQKAPAALVDNKQQNGPDPENKTNSSEREKRRPTRTTSTVVALPKRDSKKEAQLDASAGGNEPNQLTASNAKTGRNAALPQTVPTVDGEPPAPKIRWLPSLAPNLGYTVGNHYGTSVYTADDYYAAVNFADKNTKRNNTHQTLERYHGGNQVSLTQLNTYDNVLDWFDALRHGSDQSSKRSNARAFNNAFRRRCGSGIGGRRSRVNAQENVAQKTKAAKSAAGDAPQLHVEAHQQRHSYRLQQLANKREIALREFGKAAKCNHIINYITLPNSGRTVPVYDRRPAWLRLGYAEYADPRLELDKYGMKCLCGSWLMRRALAEDERKLAQLNGDEAAKLTFGQRYMHGPCALDGDCAQLHPDSTYTGEIEEVAREMFEYVRAHGAMPERGVKEAIAHKLRLETCDPMFADPKIPRNELRSIYDEMYNNCPSAFNYGLDEAIRQQQQYEHFISTDMQERMKTTAERQFHPYASEDYAAALPQQNGRIKSWLLDRHYAEHQNPYETRGTGAECPLQIMH